MSRKNAKSVDLSALEANAIAAVKGIESSYGAASSAILEFTLACKGHATPSVFEAGIARIADAAPGLAKISVGGYVSNARRIFASDAAKLAEVQKTTNGLQSIAKALPAIQKKKAEAKTRPVVATAADPKAPSTPVVATAADPMVAIANALVQLRKSNANKKPVILLIEGMEDMLDSLKALKVA